GLTLFHYTTLFRSLRNLALTGITGVVEAGVIELPGNTARPGTLDRVGQEFAGGSLNDVQRAHLRAAGRRSVGDVLAVVGGCPPIQRDSTVGGELIGVYQHAIFAGQPLAHVENGLVLRAVTAGIEVIVTADLGCRDVANREQRVEGGKYLVAPGQGSKEAAGGGHLRAHVLLLQRIAG